MILLFLSCNSLRRFSVPTSHAHSGNLPIRAGKGCLDTPSALEIWDSAQPGMYRAVGVPHGPSTSEPIWGSISFAIRRFRKSQVGLFPVLSAQFYCAEETLAPTSNILKRCSLYSDGTIVLVTFNDVWRTEGAPTHNCPTMY